MNTAVTSPIQASQDLTMALVMAGFFPLKEHASLDRAGRLGKVSSPAYYSERVRMPNLILFSIPQAASSAYRIHLSVFHFL